MNFIKIYVQLGTSFGIGKQHCTEKLSGGKISPDTFMLIYCILINKNNV